MFVIELQTVNCVICSQPATQWSGHVVALIQDECGDDGSVQYLGPVKITAGTCSNCSQKRGQLANHQGCLGYWRPVDGLSSSQLPWMQETGPE